MINVICKLKGHNWGEWEHWEATDELRLNKTREFRQGSKALIPASYTYRAYRSRRRYCQRCDEIDYESTSYDEKTLDEEDWTKFDAQKVHHSEELRNLINQDTFHPIVEFPSKDQQESIDAHKEAKSRDAPIEIGDYITAGIEDLSKHHSGVTDPLIRHEGYVIFIKKSPDNLSIGDKITTKVTSFNKGDSANAVFIQKEDE